MTLADLPHVELGAVLYDGAKYLHPGRYSAAVDRRWARERLGECERIVLLPDLRCVAIVYRDDPCELVPVEHCYCMLERRSS